MLLKTREVSHLRQTRSDNCVAACLAMVTGKTIEDVEGELLFSGFKTPYSEAAYIPYLVRNNIFPEKISYTMRGPLLDNTVYLISCSSKLTAGAFHMIVGVMHEGTMIIKDPSDNLEKENIYSDKGFIDGSIPTFEYLALVDCELDNE